MLLLIITIKMEPSTFEPAATITELNQQEAELTHLENQVDSKIENFANPTELKETPLTSADEDLLKKFYEKLETLNPSERTQALRYFRMKQDEMLNPEKSKYTTIPDNNRKTILERFRMKKASLQTARKSVAVKKKIMESSMMSDAEPITEPKTNTAMSKSKQRRMKLKAKLLKKMSSVAGETKDGEVVEETKDSEEETSTESSNNSVDKAV